MVANKTQQDVEFAGLLAASGVPRAELFLTTKIPSPMLGAKLTAAAIERARKETHGAGWRSRVFTGTHEDIEMEKGVVRNMVHTRSYFKQPGGRPSLREGQERVA